VKFGASARIVADSTDVMVELSRGVAEMPIVPFAPAVAMAIHEATGVWLSDLPFTPPRVLAAFVERERHGG